MNVQADLFEAQQVDAFPDLEVPAVPHFATGEPADSTDPDPADYPGYKGPWPPQGSLHPAPWNPEEWLWEGRR